MACRVLSLGMLRYPMASSMACRALSLVLSLATLWASNVSARDTNKKPSLSSLGSISVGHPDEGVLLNSVPLPKGDAWELTVPKQAYGTRETIDGLRLCLNEVRRKHPGAPPVKLGSLSAKNGGKLPPHRSHRTGRDADVYFFRKPGANWLEAATREDIDLPRTWALLRCFVTQTDVDFVLIERKLHPWFKEHALSIGEPSQWIEKLFHDGPKYHRAVIRHAPGHVAHMHVRFVSAESRRRGVALYDRLLKEGRLPQKYRAIEHRVRSGDTLLGLALRYKTTVRSIQRLNRLRGTTIFKGKRLKISTPTPMKGARDPVVVPPRLLPPGDERRR